MSFMNPRTLVRDLAGAITAKEHLARDSGGTLYVYRGGVYRPDGEMLIRQRVKHLLLDQDCSEMWSRALSNEIVEFISLDVPEAARMALNRADQSRERVAQGQNPRAHSTLARVFVHHSDSSLVRPTGDVSGNRQVYRRSVS